MIRRDDGGRADRGPEWVERGDDDPYVDDAIGVRQRRECRDREWVTPTMPAAVTGLGADQPDGHAPFADDTERDAYRAAIRADLLRRGYLDGDRRQREDDEAAAHIEEARG